MPDETRDTKMTIPEMLDSLSQDRARMEWMEKTLRDGGWQETHGRIGDHYYANGGPLRAAIDAAMAEDAASGRTRDMAVAPMKGVNQDAEDGT